MELVDVKEIFYVDRTIKVQPTVVDITGDLADQELTAIMTNEEYYDLSDKAMAYLPNRDFPTFDIEGRYTRGAFTIAVLEGEAIVPTDILKVTIGIKHVVELCL